MYRFLFLILILCLIACNKKTSIKFNNTVHNFDTIYPIEEPKVYFTYKNIGKNKLIIDSITHSCGCTIPVYNDTPLKPMNIDSIQVEYDSKQNKGHFVKEIMVYSNAEESPHKIFIKGFSL